MAYEWLVLHYEGTWHSILLLIRLFVCPLVELLPANMFNIVFLQKSADPAANGAQLSPATRLTVCIDEEDEELEMNG